MTIYHVVIIVLQQLKSTESNLAERHSSLLNIIMLECMAISVTSSPKQRNNNADHLRC